MTPTRDSINRVQDPIQPEVKQEKNDNTHQDPQGILNQSKTDQDSQGILTKPAPIQISSQEYKSLPVAEIIQYKGIDDYIEPTISTYPTIVKTPIHYYCIDGYNLVEKAILEKLKFIVCHIIYITTDSDVELAIRKTAIRMTSEKGKPYYAELVRNCKKLEGFFLETTENPVMHSHGGKRKGVDYALDNRENNIRCLLVERLGKSLSTINKYINYGEDLDEPILDTLVQSKEGKKFFEAVASNKRQFIKNLKCDGKDEAGITEEISVKMADWLEEFHEKGKIKPLSFERSLIPEKKKCPIDPPKPFKHRGENEDNQKEETRESIKQEILIILEGACAFIKEDNGNNEEFTAIIKGEIGEIAIRLCKYDGFDKDTTTVQAVREVA